MKVRTGKLTTIAAALLLGVSALEPAAFAQSDCKEAKGNYVEVFNPGTNATTGTLSNGGWLNGTVVAVFNSGAYPTPDPMEVSFGSTFALTTNRGQLRGSRIYVLDLVRGQGVSMVKIDPAASTGIFEEATGVLFLNLIKSTTVAVGPYYEVVGGQVCFAKQNQPEDQDD